MDLWLESRRLNLIFTLKILFRLSAGPEAQHQRGTEEGAGHQEQDRRAGGQHPRQGHHQGQGQLLPGHPARVRGRQRGGGDCEGEPAQPHRHDPQQDGAPPDDQQHGGQHPVHWLHPHKDRRVCGEVSCKYWFIISTLTLNCIYKHFRADSVVDELNETEWCADIYQQREQKSTNFVLCKLSMSFYTINCHCRV